MAGDRQNTPFPNANGCNTFSAAAYRGNSAAANIWENLVCTGANGTVPHADSRVLAFDPSGNLLLGNDGGIYRLNTPDAIATRRWSSLNGDLRTLEMHSVAYDPVSQVLFGGAQDNGTPIQTTPGSFTWSTFFGADGGVVAVDTDQAVHPGTSIRYVTTQRLGAFTRSFWNAGNNLIGTATQLQLRITSGGGAGQVLGQDPNVQFYNPYVLNRIDPRRILIGTANIYESLDRGDTLADLGFIPRLVASLVYGGRRDGAANPDLFYIGYGRCTTCSAPIVRRRLTAGGPIEDLNSYPGSAVRKLAVDPQDDRRLFVVDDQSRIWSSSDAGTTWDDLTANLPALSSDIRTIELFSPSAGVQGDVLLAGGLGGAFQLRRPHAPGARQWTRLSRGLPHALVTDLRYDYTDDVLAAALFGRGAWTLRDFFRNDDGGRAAEAAAAARATTRVTTSDAPPPDIQAVPNPGPAEADPVR